MQTVIHLLQREYERLGEQADGITAAQWIARRTILHLLLSHWELSDIEETAQKLYAITKSDVFALTGDELLFYKRLELLSEENKSEQN